MPPSRRGTGPLAFLIKHSPTARGVQPLRGKSIDLIAIVIEEQEEGELLEEVGKKRYLVCDIYKSSKVQTSRNMKTKRGKARARARVCLAFVLGFAHDSPRSKAGVRTRDSSLAWTASSCGSACTSRRSCAGSRGNRERERQRWGVRLTLPSRLERNGDSSLTWSCLRPSASCPPQP